VDFTGPCAIMLGTELHGLQSEDLALADREIFIPMMGMVESFNVSVACAIVLAEAQRQRLAAGAYRRRKMSEEKYLRLRFEWLHPRLAGLCRRKNIPYPPLDADGDVIPPEPG
jgi:tRNA (guanosine-2'-O-)-methyltransferase